MDNVFLFTGGETYLLRQKVNGWKEAFRKKHGDINLAMLDAEEMELGALMADISALPFLGEKRLVFVENLPQKSKGSPEKAVSEKTAEKEEKQDETLKKFAENLEKIPETSVVVFIQPEPDKRRSFYKSLVKVAKVEEFKPMEGAALTAWAKNEAKKAGATLEAAAAEILISMTGQDGWRLSQEIRKLGDYSGGEPITRQHIDRVVTPTPEANIFHFTDALGAKDHKRALQNLHRAMAAGEELRQVFYMIVRQFRLILQVKSYAEQYPMTNAASVAAALKIHPFVARTVLAQVGRFGMRELKKAYAGLLSVDMDMKSSRIKITTEDQTELALAIERFILEFCVH